ncbi:unnamed protein product, partial [Meganyctiphanes norvegica]
TPNGIRAVWDQTQPREQCKDKHSSCPMWGTHGDCRRNPNYMVPNCAYTCNTCLVGPHQSPPPARHSPPLPLQPSQLGHSTHQRGPNTNFTTSHRHYAHP